MGKRTLEELESLNDGMDGLAELVAAVLPPAGSHDAATAQAVCAVLVELNDLRNRLRRFTAQVAAE